MGHKHQQPTITRESWPNTEKGEAVNRFYQKMAPVDQTLGMLFEVFDKARYDEYRKLYDHWADESALAGLKRTERACWSFCAILMNARVGPHRDDLDLQGGMVCMTCHGDFEGGALILRALGIQYDFQPGDVMFCNASLLEHAIGPWDGQRVSFVNTWKGDMTNVNVAVLPATLTERRQKKATHDAKNAAKEANGDPRCPFCRKWYTTVKTLRTHLNQWAKEPPKADDKKHIAQEVRDFVLKEWN